MPGVVIFVSWSTALRGGIISPNEKISFELCMSSYTPMYMHLCHLRWIDNSMTMISSPSGGHNVFPTFNCVLFSFFHVAELEGLTCSRTGSCGGHSETKTLGSEAGRQRNNFLIISKST